MLTEVQQTLYQALAVSAVPQGSPSAPHVSVVGRGLFVFRKADRFNFCGL